MDSAVNAPCAGRAANAQGESFRVSRMRENRTSGSMRGEQVAMHGMRLLSHNGETLKRKYAEA